MTRRWQGPRDMLAGMRDRQTGDSSSAVRYVVVRGLTSFFRGMQPCGWFQVTTPTAAPPRLVKRVWCLAPAAASTSDFHVGGARWLVARCSLADSVRDWLPARSSNHRPTPNCFFYQRCPISCEHAAHGGRSLRSLTPLPPSKARRHPSALWCSEEVHARLSLRSCISRNFHV